LPSWINKLFRGASRQIDDGQTSPVVVSKDAASFSINGETAPTAQVIDSAFLGLMLGVDAGQESQLSQVEKQTLVNIRTSLLKNDLPESLIPRLPGIMPKIQGALRDKNSSAAKLAEAISGDISLVGEVIRLANSPYYRTAKKIDSLEQAIVLLGINGMQQLVVSAAFKPILNAGSGHFVRSSSLYLWDKSLKAARASDCIARSVGEDRFNAYLAGLLGQSGITMIMKLLDQHLSGKDVLHPPLFFNELNRLSHLITIRIGRHWVLPETVVESFREQVEYQQPEDMSVQGSIVFMGDKLAKIRILKSKGLLQSYSEAFNCRLNGKMTHACSQCYREMGQDD